MEFKFSKDSGDIEQYKAPDEKKRQTALLILLLVLVGGFAYLYFFTDLIRPLETQKSSEIAAPAPQMVKIPLPARAGEPEKVDVKKGAGAETPKAAVIAAGPVPAPVAVPAAPPVAAPVIPAPKPAPAPVMAKLLKITLYRIGILFHFSKALPILPFSNGGIFSSTILRRAFHSNSAWVIALTLFTALTIFNISSGLFSFEGS